jgi:AcrR family transcriptional regulator
MQDEARGAAPGGRGAAARRPLMDAAAEHFGERGYKATSFRDLIAASGLSKGAFYFHFASKRDLALAVFRDRQERLGQAVMERVDRDAPALEQFRQLWMERAHILADDPSLRCLRKLAASFDEDPGLAEEITASHRGPIELMAGLLAAAQAEGDIRADIDPAAAAEVAFAVALGIDEVSERESGGTDVVRRAAGFLDVFFDGITPT